MSRTKKDIVVSIVMVAVVGMAFLIGCRGESLPGAVSQEAGRHILAVSNVLTVSNMDYLSRGGAVLMFLGVVAAALGRKIPGAVLFIGGGVMLGYFTYLSEMPWMIAAMMGIALVLFVVWLWQTGKLKSVLSEAIIAIQPHDKIKAAMGGGNTNKQAKIRKIVDPIKAELKEEGKL